MFVEPPSVHARHVRTNSHSSVPVPFCPSFRGCHKRSTHTMAPRFFRHNQPSNLGVRIGLQQVRAVYVNPPNNPIGCVLRHKKPRISALRNRPEAVAYQRDRRWIAELTREIRHRRSIFQPHRPYRNDHRDWTIDLAAT